MNETQRINYYVEPVEIEIYLKKSGTIKTIIKDLYIELVDVLPEFEPAKTIFTFFKNLDEPIDLIKLQDTFPETVLPVVNSYFDHIDLYLKLCIHMRSYISGSIDSLRHCLYLTELLMKFEPTLASLEYIGDFSTYNLNYFIRKLNEHNQEFLLEDNTVEYLINRRRKAHENTEANQEDREFEKLVELWEYNIKESPLS